MTQYNKRDRLASLDFQVALKPRVARPLHSFAGAMLPPLNDAQDDARHTDDDSGHVGRSANEQIELRGALPEQRRRDSGRGSHRQHASGDDQANDGGTPTEGTLVRSAHFVFAGESVPGQGAQPLPMPVFPYQNEKKNRDKPRHGKHNQHARPPSRMGHAGDGAVFNFLQAISF